MSGFRPFVMARVVFGLITRIERFAGDAMTPRDGIAVTFFTERTIGTIALDFVRAVFIIGIWRGLVGTWTPAMREKMQADAKRSVRQTAHTNWQVP